MVEVHSAKTFLRLPTEGIETACGLDVILQPTWPLAKLGCYTHRRLN
jgi:hypothetical protein